MSLENNAWTRALNNTMSLYISRNGFGGRYSQEKTKNINGIPARSDCSGMVSYALNLIGAITRGKVCGSANIVSELQKSPLFKVYKWDGSNPTGNQKAQIGDIFIYPRPSKDVSGHVTVCAGPNGFWDYGGQRKTITINKAPVKPYSYVARYVGSDANGGYDDVPQQTNNMTNQQRMSNLGQRTMEENKTKLTSNRLKQIIRESIEDVLSDFGDNYDKFNNRHDSSDKQQRKYVKFNPDKQEWLSLMEDGEPALNTPFLMNLDGEIKLAWRRASDGKYETRGYYEEDTIEPEDFKYCYL